MGPGAWENDRGGTIRVLQAFRQPKNSSTLFLICTTIYSKERTPPRYGHTASAASALL